MRINKLAITNFKGFDFKEFEFPSQFTVIIGNNATGKTSVLDALAVAAGAYLLGIDGADSRHILRDEVRVVWDEVEPLPQVPVVIQGTGIVHNKQISWRRRLSSFSGRTTRKGSEELARLAEQHQAAHRLDGANPIFPVIAYHGTGRLWAEHQEKVDYRRQEEGVVMGYKDCLSPKSSSKAFLSWYKTYWATIRDFGDKDTKEKQLLNVFNESITELIPEWHDMRYHTASDQLIGFYKSPEGDEKRMAFNQLSDGYRNMIGMAADIVYRCLKLNPHLGEKAVKETPGIVLIDELDLHLHPKWQREIVERFKKTFPKIQFVCTTHSPFIVQSLKAEELINLDGEVLAADPYKRSLEENIMYMGAEVGRSEKFQQKVEDVKRFDSILESAIKSETRRKKKLDKKDMDELNEILLRNSDDPALVARLEIKKLSKLGPNETS